MGFGSGTGGLLRRVLSTKEVMFSLSFLGMQVLLPLAFTPSLPSSWVLAAITPVVVPLLYSPSLPHTLLSVPGLGEWRCWQSRRAESGETGHIPLPASQHLG